MTESTLRVDADRLRAFVTAVYRQAGTMRAVTQPGFEARMERYFGDIKSAPRAPGCEEIFYPGELEARNDAANRTRGLRLPEATIAELHALSRATGIGAGS